MNIKKLKVGMEIKNYKELCKLLGIEPKTGNSKIKQIKEFDKYFQYEKIGYSYKITMVYNKPRAFTEQEMIELLLLDLLAGNESEDKYTFISTKRTMYEKLKMVNFNYKYCYSNPKQVANYKSIPEKVVVDTTNSIDKALKTKLLKVLDNLSDRRILFYNDVYMICCSNKDGSHRIATDEEIKICLEIEGDILKKLKCKSYTDVIVRGVENKYNKLVNEKLSEIGIKFFYKAIKIIFIKERISELFDKHIQKLKLSNRNYKIYANKVNREIQAQTNSNANKRFEKAGIESIEIFNKIKEMNEINEKINKECRPSGFNVSPPKERLEELEAERIDEYEIEKLKDRLEILRLRSDKNYLLHVKELVKLIISMNTDMCTEEIRALYNKNANTK